MSDLLLAKYQSQLFLLGRESGCKMCASKAEDSGERFCGAKKKNRYDSNNYGARKYVPMCGR